MRKVLCIRRGALGDTILMIPILRALRAEEPDAVLHFAGALDFAVLLERYGIVDRAFSSEDLNLWALEASGPDGDRTRARLAGYDRMVTDDPVVVSSRAPRVHELDPVLDEAAGVSAAAQLLARSGVAATASSTSVSASLRDRRRLLAAGAGIVLHPGSGSAAKCWQRASWDALAARLVARGHAVTMAFGPAEVERGHGSRAGLPAGVTVFEGRGITELAACLERARCFVGNDSGVTHLAAALGTPTVAVFGPTDPRVWAPQGAHVRVVGRRTSGPPQVSVDGVLDAVEATAG